MLPASLAADVPVFIATPTSAWASAGASLVPSPVIATMRPFACSSLISASFASGVASARKSSTPASSAITAAVTRLSPVIITVRMPIRRSSSKRSRMPPLTMSFRWMTPRTKLSWATTSGVPPARAILSTSSSSRARHLAALLLDPALDRVGGALAVLVAVEVDAAHARGRRERDEGRVELARARGREARTAPSRARRSSGPRASRRRARRAGPPRPARRRARRRPGRTRRPGGCRA